MANGGCAGEAAQAEARRAGSFTHALRPGLNCVAPYGAGLWHEHAVLRWELEVVRAQAGVPAAAGRPAPRKAGLRHLRPTALGGKGNLKFEIGNFR